MPILAIHDLSCYSKSSLTVVLPVLEALGVETAVLPTALLSTQTDGFDDIYIQNEDEAMGEILNRFFSLHLSFDGIYSGFLASASVIERVLSLISASSALALVDPVMGDDGKLYQTVDEELCSAMFRLVRKADIITPNFTEAMILTQMDDGFRPQGQKAIRDQIAVLRSLGPAKGVITGIPLQAGGLGNAAWDGNEIRLFQYPHELLGIGRQGVHVPALPFRIDGVEGQRGLAASAQACNYHEFIPRDGKRHVPEIVDLCSCNVYVFLFLVHSE